MNVVNRGDVLLLWHMPYPIATKLIYMFTNSNCDHCATVLGNNIVYEATPPRARKMTWDAYQDQMLEWSNDAKRWRDRTGKNFICEIWRNPGISSIIHDNMLKEAEIWMGVRYSMVLNYVFDLRSIHCSELCARILSHNPQNKFNKTFSRVQPIEVRNLLELNGWEKDIWSY